MRAQGSFEVRMVAQGDADAADGTTLGRMALDKQYAGDLAGSARGTMLSALTAVQGSAGYVAIDAGRGSSIAPNPASTTGT